MPQRVSSNSRRHSRNQEVAASHQIGRLLPSANHPEQGPNLSLEASWTLMCRETRFAYASNLALIVTFPLNTRSLLAKEKGEKGKQN